MTKAKSILHKITAIAVLLILNSCSTEAPTTTTTTETETTYYPPTTGNSWETKTIVSLGWKQDAVQPLLDYLAVKNSKSFILMVDGRIVLENYFNGHSQTTGWYWASAGKTLTSTLTGIAEQEGYLNLNSKVSDYIGTGWTSIPLAKENLITNKHLLTMTSGLEDIANGDDVTPAKLTYKADAGTRWAYHNVYVKLQDVIAKATNQTWSTYFNNKLRDKIGMDGTWFQSGNYSVYYSTSRSMARFALLIANKGKWKNTQILNEKFGMTLPQHHKTSILAMVICGGLMVKAVIICHNHNYKFQVALSHLHPMICTWLWAKTTKKYTLYPAKKWLL